MGSLWLLVRSTRVPMVVAGLVGLTLGLIFGLSEGRGDEATEAVSSPRGAVSPSPSPAGCTQPPSVLMVAVEAGPAAAEDLDRLAAGIDPKGHLDLVEERVPFEPGAVVSRSDAISALAGDAQAVVLVLRLHPGPEQLELVARLAAEVGPRLHVVAAGEEESVSNARGLTELGGGRFLELSGIDESSDRIGQQPLQRATRWLAARLTCP